MDGKLEEGYKFSLSYYSDINYGKAMVALKIKDVEFEFSYYGYVLNRFGLIMMFDEI